MGYLARARFLERLRRLFGGNPPRVQAAALPWRRTLGGIEVLLVTSHRTGRWVLPKGWPEGREALFETAAREAIEEAGVKGKISKAEIGRYCYGKQSDAGMKWRCEVAVFPLEVKHEASKWPERKKRTRRWFGPEEAARMVEEAELAELLAAFRGNPRKITA